MRFKTNNKKITLEDTNYLKVRNYPPTNNTYSYITRTYREYKEGVFGWHEIDGDPIYFHDLSKEQLALAVIIGNAQNALLSTLPREKLFKKIDE